MAIHIPATCRASRKERDELKAFGQERGLRVYDDFKRLERDFPAAMTQVRQRCGAAENDLLLLAAWPASRRGIVPKRPSTRRAASCASSARRSSTTGKSCSIPRIFNFCGLLDFPMFEWDEEENRWNAAHHPFTSVHDDATSAPRRDSRRRSDDLRLWQTESQRLGMNLPNVPRTDHSGMEVLLLNFFPHKTVFRRRLPGDLPV